MNFKKKKLQSKLSYKNSESSLNLTPVTAKLTNSDDSLYNPISYHKQSNKVTYNMNKNEHARLKSFSNYPKECSLPSCLLVEKGFYFSMSNKSFVCHECNFSYDHINQTNIYVILREHYLHNSQCNQVLNNFRIDETDEIGSLANNQLKLKEDEIMDDTTTNDVSDRAVPSPLNLKMKKIFQNDENRLKSFEGLQMKFKPVDLASSGFYYVNILSKIDSDSLGYSNSIMLNKDKLGETTSQIEHLALLVPALIHIKCAFCSYECLLFKNRLLNSSYNCPIEEHKLKMQNECPKVQPLSSTSQNQARQALLSNKFKEKYSWIKLLLDSSALEEPKTLEDIFVKENEPFDVIVKQIPKIIDSYISYEMNKNKTEAMETTSSTSTNSAMHYLPGANSSSGTEFYKLQNILNSSKNVISEKAKHPQFSTLHSRLTSFKDWPATMSQRPTELAKAGFYYYGIKDMTKCFFCNGGLKNWDHNQDPFEDHVRWFPNCQYIQQLMGSEYIEKIRIKYENADSGFAEPDQLNSFGSMNSMNTGVSSIDSNTSNSLPHSMQRQKRSVSPRTLNSRMDTNIVRKIVDQKILNADSIKISFERRLAVFRENGVYGDDYKNPLELAKVAYEFQQNKIKRFEAFKNLSDFIITKLPSKVKISHIFDLLAIKFGVYAESIRILREKIDTYSRSFCLVTLKDSDKDKSSNMVDNIVEELNGKIYPDDGEAIIVIKTSWNTVEKQIATLVSKPIVNSSSMVPSTDLSTNNTASLNNSLNQQNSIMNNSIVPNKTSMTGQGSPADMSTLSPQTAKMKLDDENLDLEQEILREENERLKNQRLCTICLSKDKNVLFLPCAHLASCLDCSMALQFCPICRTKIQATVRTYT